MNKLLTLASAVALTTSVASADMGNGMYTALKLGYSGTTAKAKALNNVAVPGAGNWTTTSKSKTGHGVLGGLSVGYNQTMSNKLMLGASLGANFDSGKTRAGMVTGGATGKVTFTPKWNIDLTLRAGRMFNDKMAGYLGLGHEFGFAQYKFGSRVKDNVRTFSLVPHVGVMGNLQEKVSWLGEVGYKFATNVSGLKAVHKQFVNKKPHGFQAKVGVAYHF